MQQPGDSEHRLATTSALELSRSEPLRVETPSFVRGICAGLAVAMVLGHVWLATMLAPASEMYAQFGGQVPAITQLVISSGWLWGVAVLGAIATAFVLVRRPRALWYYLVLVLLLATTVVGTWHWSQKPLRVLVDDIR